jgi:hypothetical protein
MFGDYREKMKAMEKKNLQGKQALFLKFSI